MFLIILQCSFPSKTNAARKISKVQKRAGVRACVQTDDRFVEEAVVTVNLEKEV
jgi:hypothetical protein